MNTRPIGVFDSGFGGASVLKEALRMLPTENYIYYGDNKNAPYGDKDEDIIATLSFDCADFLIKKGVKTILLACNTATGTCIKDIRDRLFIPVVSIEPAIKPACLKDGDGKILMLATRATTRLERYKKLQERMPDPDRVINVACSGLVDRIESGKFGDDDFEDLLYGFLKEYEGMKIDGIVLGCTHYVFIKGAIKKYADKHFEGDSILYDGNVGTVRQLYRILERNNLINTEGNGKVEFYSSDESERVSEIFNMLLAQ